MKRTDLVKNLGMKIRGQMQRSPVPERFAAGAAEVADKRAQRKADAAAKLVPFAVRLPHALVVRLREQAVQDGVGVHELTARLLQAGLGEPAGAVAPLDGARSAPTEAEHTTNQSGPVKLVRREEAAAAARKTPVAGKKAARKVAAAPEPAAKKAAAKKAAVKKVAAKQVAQAPAKTAPAPASKSASKTAGKVAPATKKAVRKSPKSA